MNNSNTPGNPYQLWMQASRELESARARIAALEAQVEEVRKQLERYQWRPISEAHEDYGNCIYINILEPEVLNINHVLDESYEDCVEGMTHFAQLPPLTSKMAEKLIEDMKGII